MGLRSAFSVRARAARSRLRFVRNSTGRPSRTSTRRAASQPASGSSSSRSGQSPRATRQASRALRSRRVSKAARAESSAVAGTVEGPAGAVAAGCRCRNSANAASIPSTSALARMAPRGRTPSVRTALAVGSFGAIASTAPAPSRSATMREASKVPSWERSITRRNVRRPSISRYTRSAVTLRFRASLVPLER